jgi:hypothetical protein
MGNVIALDEGVRSILVSITRHSYLIMHLEPYDGQMCPQRLFLFNGIHPAPLVLCPNAERSVLASEGI